MTLSEAVSKSNLAKGKWILFFFFPCTLKRLLCLPTPHTFTYLLLSPVSHWYQLPFQYWVPLNQAKLGTIWCLLNELFLTGPSSRKKPCHPGNSVKRSRHQRESEHCCYSLLSSARSIPPPWLRFPKALAIPAPEIHRKSQCRRFSSILLFPVESWQPPGSAGENKPGSGTQQLFQQWSQSHHRGFFTQFSLLQFFGTHVSIFPLVIVQHTEI